MSIMKMTLIGAQTALSTLNENLFDFLSLPEGIDEDTLKDNIIDEGGDFEVIYGNPEFLRAKVGTWSSKYYRTFEKWVNALAIEYNPLENYDRQEDWSDSGRKDNGLKHTVDITTTDGGTITSNGGVKTSGSTENTVSAFDSSTYQPSDKQTVSNQDTTNTKTTTSNSSREAGYYNDEFGEGTSATHSGRIHGNIGVTTSQQMLQSEIDIARFNLIQQITDIFLQEFCIMVYD